MNKILIAIAAAVCIILALYFWKKRKEKFTATEYNLSVLTGGLPMTGRYAGGDKGLVAVDDNDNNIAPMGALAGNGVPIGINTGSFYNNNSKSSAKKIITAAAGTTAGAAPISPPLITVDSAGGSTIGGGLSGGNTLGGSSGSALIPIPGAVPVVTTGGGLLSGSSTAVDAIRRARAKRRVGGRR